MAEPTADPAGPTALQGPTVAAHAPTGRRADGPSSTPTRRARRGWRPGAADGRGSSGTSTRPARPAAELRPGPSRTSTAGRADGGRAAGPAAELPRPTSSRRPTSRWWRAARRRQGGARSRHRGGGRAGRGRAARGRRPSSRGAAELGVEPAADEAEPGRTSTRAGPGPATGQHVDGRSSGDIEAVVDTEPTAAEEEAEHHADTVAATPQAQVPTRGGELAPTGPRGRRPERGADAADAAEEDVAVAPGRRDRKSMMPPRPRRCPRPSSRRRPSRRPPTRPRRTRPRCPRPRRTPTPRRPTTRPAAELAVEQNVDRRPGHGARSSRPRPGRARVS